jgi:putative oxidoreductase
MGLPFPTLQAYLATGAEVLAFILLPLGLATRFLALPLMITMRVAITMVHGENGFSSGDGGFEIPFYYLLMLAVLFFGGPGRISLDYWIAKWVNKPKQESKPVQR